MFPISHNAHKKMPKHTSNLFSNFTLFLEQILKKEKKNCVEGRFQKQFPNRSWVTHIYGNPALKWFTKGIDQLMK